MPVATIATGVAVPLSICVFTPAGRFPAAPVARR
jgi:hypothetical protein